MTETAERSVHVRICGRVQGVGYRAWVRDRAEALGLGGWVRNRASGEVEAVFSGAAPQVDEMLQACRRGPDWARVEAVEILSEAAPIAGRFSVERTV